MNSILLENERLQIAVDASSAGWSLSGDSDTLRLEAAPPILRARPDFDSRAFAEWEAAGEPTWADSPHGRLHQVTLISSPPGLGVRLDLTLALPERLPALFWKLRLHQRGSRPVIIDRLDLLSARLDAGHNLNPKAAAFFSNGWQSWAYTGAYYPGDRFRRTRLGPLRAPSAFNSGTPQPSRAGHFSSDFFGILADRSTRRGLLIGFLSQRRHFGTLTAHLESTGARLQLWANGDTARLDPGADMETDWACAFALDLDAPDPLGKYLAAVGIENGVAGNYEQSAIPTGWCSWYQFSSEDYLGTITADDLRRNLEAVDARRGRIPLEIIQIDDGFQSQVGDWFSFRSGFPAGVAPLAAEIRAAGFTPGLWLAPFIAHAGSRLAAEHPDWVLQGRFGLPANAGFLWNHFARGLDVSNPGVLDYTETVIRTAVQEWGFRYLKLDFLYAGVIPGRRFDPAQTRAQALYTALKRIRSAAGEHTLLLGCGCPLGPAVGMVDAMRISTDTGRRWKPAFKGIKTFFAAEPDFPSAAAACHNSLTRAALHRRWWINDPDCLLVRPDTELTLAEVQTTATVIALTGGSLLLSDDLPALPPERLQIVQALLPLIGRRPQVIDWLDSTTPERVRLDLEGPAGRWVLLAAFNWSDRPRDLTVNFKEYGFDEDETAMHLRDFWGGQVAAAEQLPSGVGRIFRSVPAHGVVLVAARPASLQPIYLGSDLHISQGLEVTDWKWDEAAGRLEARIERPGAANGIVDLHLPRPPHISEMNGAPLQARLIGDGCYRLHLDFTGAARLTLRL